VKSVADATHVNIDKPGVLEGLKHISWIGKPVFPREHSLHSSSQRRFRDERFGD
jgi:hypothetical protein